LTVATRGVEAAAAAAELGKVTPKEPRASFCSLAGRRRVDPVEAAQLMAPLRAQAQDGVRERLDLLETGTGRHHLVQRVRLPRAALPNSRWQ
jgi:hypothetical protein